MTTYSNYIIIMMGYTAVGKSTLAKKLSAKLDCDIFHSAITRKKLGLSPKKEDAKAFFFLDNPERKKVDKIVYLKNLNNAKESLQSGSNVILDSGYFHRWQRIQVYKLADELNCEVFIIRVLFDNEKVIKERLNNRMKKFDESPLNETPGWETYVDSLKLTQLPYCDVLPNGLKPMIIEFDYNKKKVCLTNQNDKYINIKNIVKTIREIMGEKKRKY